MSTVICWFHHDLRIGDHPALTAAIASGAAVLPVYILDDDAAGDWAMGGASRWWLHHSLSDLEQGLRRLGGGLTIRRGDAEALIPQLMVETGATALYTSRRGEPWAKQQLDRIIASLKPRGITTHVSNGPFLIEPGDVLSKSGTR
ncbi:MAG: deoxyribodipyrimidine photo-lyase, partial [Alphaproteobacteria bacterium]